MLHYCLIKLENLANKTFQIGISCIGSGVGQSVINSLRLSRLPIKTIGFGTNPFAYGAYDCDAYDYTPGFYNGGIRPEIIINDINIKMVSDMDSSLFYGDMNWKPKYNIENTIDSLFQYFQANKQEKLSLYFNN